MIRELTLPEIAPGALPEDDHMNVVMFYGATCGPCKNTMPHYEAAVAYFESMNAKIRFYKFNTWESPEVVKYCADTWGVNGVPNFKIFFRGQELVNKQGGGDEVAMKKMIVDGVGEAFKRFGEAI